MNFFITSGIPFLVPILHTAKSFPSKAGANYDVITHSFKLRDVVNGGNGFMLVNESVEQETLSHNLRMTAELMDLMSSTSSVDHPVCQDCCESLLSTLENELEKVESDLRDYNVLRNKLRLEEKNRHSTVGRAEMNDMIKKLDEMKENEKDLLLELKRLQIEEEVADRELAELEKERDGLVSEEQRYLKEYAKYKQETLCLEDETRSVECQLRYAQTQLEKVRNTTVFSAAFHIWIANDFGVINGFRLGRLYEQPVEWWEINAAWGQTALLLSSMAAKRSFVFNKYKIVPYGNFSCIKIIDDNKTLNLYGSGSFRTGIFSDRSFDQGMVAFLDCLQQLKAEMERTDDLRLPHGIDKDKGRIDDGVGNWYSIK
ncbi:unnamed protein product [Notodromas monacha]|uniref:Autophagy-related protein 6 n=1 Tax=Notodromas monacha TaxID=399045 RepID=A0A7R9BID6_9CRUS|nr:unnamed protein product [Notodromas monacha]CAG0914487.1 unnamed protein product [Notodromas monacha]